MMTAFSSARLLVGLLIALGAWWVYHRLFLGTGRLPGVLIAILFGVVSYNFPDYGIPIITVLFIFGSFLELRRWIKKEDYSYSHLIYEGGGIRRGLTSEEVGVLNHLDRSSLFVLGLIKLLKKGFVEYKQFPDGGITIKPTNELAPSSEVLHPQSRREARQFTARQKKELLTSSEDVLVEIFIQNSNLSVGEYSIQPWIDFINREVQAKISGYDQTQTVDYYQNYINHRLDGVAAGYFELEDYFDWLFLSAYLGVNNHSNLTKLLQNSRPGWIHESENVVSFANLIRSVRWT